MSIDLDNVKINKSIKQKRKLLISGKEYEFCSRRRAILEAINFCSDSKYPNVIPETNSLPDGLGGIFMFESNKQELGKVLYFPLVEDMDSEKIPKMNRINILDRLGIIDFFDLRISQYPNRIVGITSIDRLTCNIVNFFDYTCVEFPKILESKYPSISAIMSSKILKSNCDELFKEFVFQPIFTMMEKEKKQ